jgi:hypothetical protein
MKKTCIQCNIEKEIIEFEYYYFKKRYSSKCKNCAVVPHTSQTIINGRPPIDFQAPDLDTGVSTSF